MWFDWDERKATGNLTKHGVSFQEAATVFGDSLSLTYPDHAHSEGERRWIMLGVSEKQRVLVVAHTETATSCRIISARRATRKEQIFYEKNQ